MIIVIKSDENGRPMAAPTLSTIINQFKGYVSKQIGVLIWQKGYYEKILRTAKGYREIWLYIDRNPLKLTDHKYLKIQ